MMRMRVLDESNEQPTRTYLEAVTTFQHGLLMRFQVPTADRRSNKMTVHDTGDLKIQRIRRIVDNRQNWCNSRQPE